MKKLTISERKVAAIEKQLLVTINFTDCSATVKGADLRKFLADLGIEIIKPNNRVNSR